MRCRLGRMYTYVRKGRFIGDSTGRNRSTKQIAWRTCAQCVSCVYLNCTICKTLISLAIYIHISKCNSNYVMFSCSVFAANNAGMCTLYARWLRYQPIIIFESTCAAYGIVEDMRYACGARGREKESLEGGYVVGRVGGTK